MKNSEIYKNYFFDKEELEKVKIDITFLENNDSNNINNSNNNININLPDGKESTQLAVEFTKNYVKKFPEISYVIKIIKRLLQIENLNNSFNGN